ncbi:helix-turn-helix transcriptional regulator [Antarcticirhabdus aurantiaca]|uniref:Helix-turn-helix transcriptional regulator n=1 Tax=Antarcticirhabdus aurantiaca TaxID=2606717 RepID=A0ACD4NSA7_9HYPH|nr:helix-turn-helix transcriptional regulator [Antarcticirhabdus aurantiaca]WAJ29657.1 helix-turn-helix transcriptional regulator [Jeongeuplla avenae]
MEPGRFSDLIERCYDAAFDAHAWSSVLDDVARELGGCGANLLRLTGKAPPLVSYSPSLAEFVPAYDSIWCEHDTFVLYAKEHRLGPGIHVDSDYLPAELRARDPFYQEFRRPQKMSSILSFVAALPQGEILSINVQRRLDTQEVDAEDRVVFGRLGRHLAKSVSLSARLSEAEAVSAKLGDQLAGFDCAVALVEAGGRVLRGNALLHALEGDGLHVRRGRLVHASATGQKRFEAFLHALFGADPHAPAPDILALPRPGSALPLLLRGVALSASIADRRLGAGHRSVLLTILRPDLPGYPDLEPVLAALGLTPAQARVALAVGAGHRLAEAAELFRISEETARTLVKQAYARLGINRQSQLAGLIAKVAPLRR